MMCQFTEDEVCNCISIPGEPGGRSPHKRWSFQTLFLRQCISFFLTHLTVPIACQSDTPANRMVDTTDMARFSEQKQNLQRLLFPEYHTLRTLWPCQIKLMCWTSCTNGLLTVCIWVPDSVSGRRCRHISASSVHVVIWQGLTSSWAAPWERGGFKLFYLSRSSHLPSGPLTPAP